MHKAVDNMKSESHTCFMFFILQLLFFHLSSFLMMWTLYSRTVALIINVILLIFLVLFIYNGYDIYSQLHVNDSDAVSGQFTNFAEAQYAAQVDED